MTDVFTHVPLGVDRSWGHAMLRGFRMRCPACGQGSMFARILKVADSCPHCHEELHHHRADDAPPYFTIFIVGHIVIPLVLVIEKIWHPNMLWFVGATAIVTLALTAALMPRVKGAVVAMQWALRMHGFDYAARGNPAAGALDKDPAPPA
ncbi:MAG: DUF983 domain-containing protein [Rhizobiales bacterium]|nr:DUF983 domain-containing protein [Hyphomicrobiales bacterium]